MVVWLLVSLVALFFGLALQQILQGRALFAFVRFYSISTETSEGGGTVTVALPLKNLGLQPATIQKITTSCNCATAWTDSSVIPPLGTLTVWLKVKTNGVRGDVAAKVACQTNSTFNSIVVSDAVINVQPIARVLRGSGYFGTVRLMDIPYSRTIYLDFARKVSGLHIKSHSELFYVSLDTDKEVPNLWSLNVRLAKNSVGKVEDEITLVDEEGNSLLNIPVFAQVIQ